MLKLVSFIFLLSVTASSGYAQYTKLNDYRLFDSVVVKQRSDSLSFPWAGGFLQPIFSEINLNQDSLSDLIVFDKGSFQHRTFIRSKPGANYQLVRTYSSQIATSRFFSLFVDYNQDGLEDQFFNENGIIGVNKNTSSNGNELTFERLRFNDVNNKNRKSIKGSFSYDNNMLPFTVGASEVPAIADFDGDGDIDFVNLAVGLGSAYLYENTGSNNHSSLDSLEFTLTNFCWGGFIDNPTAFFINMGSCAGKFLSSGSRHGGANLSTTDLDCNGLPDLMIGFVGEQKVIGLFNNGASNVARMTEQDTSFPKSSKTIRSNLFPHLSTIKINNDSIDDFLVSPLDDVSGANHKQVQYYESIPDTSCKMNYVPARSFISEELIDIGEQSRFVLIDINGDSLLDILGSSLKLNDGDTVWNSIFYWKNCGTRIQPSFELISESFLPLPFTNNYDINIQPIDFDADGSIDLVLSNEDGRLKWLKNIALPGDSCQFIETPSTLDSLKLDPFPKITFFDFNRDSLPDLLAGSKETHLNYYENTGLRGNPEFKKAITKKNFSGISLADEFGNGYLQPTVIVSDSTGVNTNTLDQKTYLYIGTASGWLYQFVNDSAATFDDYQLRDSLFLYNRYVTPFSGDLNGDNKPDMIFGMNTGGASILMKDAGFIIPKPKEKDKDPEIIDTTTVMENNSHQKTLWKVYPNPANDKVTIEIIDHQEASNTQLLLQNINGQTVLKAQNINPINQLDISDLTSGVYFIQLRNASHSQSIKLVKY